MLTRVRAYSLLVLYICSAIGLVVDFHYCGGELAKVALYQANEKDCCGEHTDQKPDCCSDHYICMDTDDSESAKSVTVSLPLFTAFTLPKAFDLPGQIRGAQVEAPSPMDHAPPNRGGTAVYLQCRTLLI